MGATVSLIPELEDVVQHGTRAKRVDALQRITALFLDGAKPATTTIMSTCSTMSSAC